MRDGILVMILVVTFVVIVVATIVAIVSEIDQSWAIGCNDRCVIDRRIKQVDYCIGRERLTRFECVILVGME